MTKDLTLKEKELTKAFSKLYETSIEMTKCDIDALSTMIKFNEYQLKEHYKNKPFKFFKKKYQEWEEEMERLISKVYHLYESYGIAIDDYYDLTN